MPDTRDSLMMAVMVGIKSSRHSCTRYVGTGSSMHDFSAVLCCWADPLRSVVFNSEGVTVVVEVLLYVHRNRRLIRDGSPGRPPRHSDSSWVVRVSVALHRAFWISTQVVTACFSWCMAGATNASGETTLSLCRYTSKHTRAWVVTPPSTPRLGLCHSILTPPTKRKTWAVSQHTDTSKNTTAWAVTAYWYLQEHERLGLCHNTLTPPRTPRLGLCHNTLTPPRTPRHGLCHNTLTSPRTPRLGLCHNTLTPPIMTCSDK